MAFRKESNGHSSKRFRVDSGLGSVSCHPSTSFNFDDPSDDILLTQLNLAGGENRSYVIQENNQTPSRKISPTFARQVQDETDGFDAEEMCSAELLVADLDKSNLKASKGEKETNRLKAELEAKNVELLQANGEAKILRENLEKMQREQVEFHRINDIKQQNDFKARDAERKSLTRRIEELTDRIKFLEHDLKKAKEKSSTPLHSKPVVPNERENRNGSGFPNPKTFKEPPNKRRRNSSVVDAVESAVSKSQYSALPSTECQTEIRTYKIERKWLLTPFMAETKRTENWLLSEDAIRRSNDTKLTLAQAKAKNLCKS